MSDFLFDQTITDKSNGNRVDVTRCSVDDDVLINVTPAGIDSNIRITFFLTRAIAQDLGAALMTAAGAEPEEGEVEDFDDSAFEDLDPDHLREMRDENRAIIAENNHTED